MEHNAASSAVSAESASTANTLVGVAGLDVTAFFWLLLIASVVAMLGQRIKVPYALALVVSGLLIGAPRLLPTAHLDPHTLFTVFLPPLLFESALNIRIESLQRNWKPVAIFAVAGTLLSTAVIGLLAAPALGLPLAVALVFGALISPTDPISVIAVFKQLGVGKRLSLLVEAESLFNDGVAVVLFSLLTAVAMGGAVTLAEGVQRFIIVVAGGAFIGAAVGGVGSRVTREFDDRLLEIMLTTVVAFGAYLGAEALNVSGVVAVVVAGLVMGSYGMATGMSPMTRLAVGSFWEYAAFAVNSLVFLLLGIEVTFVRLWGQAGPILLAIAIMLFGRAVAIYGLSPLVNRMRGDVPIAYQHVMFWGGLRGALPIALVLGLPQNFPQRQTLLPLTFGVVFVSLLTQGMTMKRLLRHLGLITTSNRNAEYGRLASQILACHAALRELDTVQATGAMSRAAAEQVAQEYRTRLTNLEQEAERLHQTDADFNERQVAEARRVALLAERSALRNAERSGLLDEEDLRQLTTGLDDQILEFRNERLGH
ncbi:MAG TPA: Na+/H+ antiporter [Abditibacteriaceae bacterium]|jgi:CPA1 family monovalent cation:H+ antiporter